jgi:circadian clock protein KaiB
MSRPVNFKFQLYIAGDTPNSALAVANLNALCRTHLAHHHQIEIIDVFRDPQRALADGIFMTPTLVRRLPAPVKKIVGTLSQLPRVLQILGLESTPS